MLMRLLFIHLRLDLELEYETVETGKKETHCIRVWCVYSYNAIHCILHTYIPHTFT